MTTATGTKTAAKTAGKTTRKKENGIEVAGRLIGFTLMIVSMVFTCALLQSFAHKEWETVVYIVFGMAIQGAQTLLFLWFHAGEDGLSGALWFLLFGLSLVGTVGYFAVSDAEQAQSSLHSDHRYAEMRAQASDLRDQIGSARTSMEEYAKRRYFTHGVKPVREEIAALRAEQRELRREMADFTPQAHSSQALYNLLARWFGGNPDDVKLTVFVCYALALDLVSAFLLSKSIQVGTIRLPKIRKKTKTDPKSGATLKTKK